MSFKSNDHSLHESEPRWFAVYTRFKREKVVHKRLQEKGIDVYLPLQRFARQYDRKLRSVELPLIGNYIFTRITKKEYVPVLSTADVVHFVKCSQQLIAVPEREIRILQRVVGEAVDIEIEPRQSYVVGDLVEVIGGSLTGLRGILVEKDQKKNFLIELEGIGYALRMQLDPALLQRIAAKPALA
jgi:transcription antitermination factor NusG